jgi:hypothetical protein
VAGIVELMSEHYITRTKKPPKECVTEAQGIVDLLWQFREFVEVGAKKDFELDFVLVKKRQQCLQNASAAYTVAVRVLQQATHNARVWRKRMIKLEGNGNCALVIAYVHAIVAEKKVLETNKAKKLALKMFDAELGRTNSLLYRFEHKWCDGAVANDVPCQTEMYNITVPETVWRVPNLAGNGCLDVEGGCR